MSTRENDELQLEDEEPLDDPPFGVVLKVWFYVLGGPATLECPCSPGLRFYWPEKPGWVYGKPHELEPGLRFCPHCGEMVLRWEQG